MILNRSRPAYLHQYFGHLMKRVSDRYRQYGKGLDLISALPTTNIYDNITVGEFRKSLRDDSFATAKGSGNSSCSSLYTTRYFISTMHKYSRHQAYGNRASRIRCPVSRGKSAVCFSATGRGARTGQSCIIVCLVVFPSNSVSRTISCAMFSAKGDIK